MYTQSAIYVATYVSQEGRDTLVHNSTVMCVLNQDD